MQHPLQQPLRDRETPVLPPSRQSIRTLGPYESAIISLMLWSFLHAGEALAGDATTALATALKPDFELGGTQTRLSSWPLPLTSFDSRLPTLDTKAFSSEFRPRGPSILANDSKDTPADGSQHGSVWQRLGEFRTQNRLRLLTLWQNGGHSLSLQAGRRGDPTLQWTSRLNHRNVENGGLFDELFSSSSGGAIGRGLRLLPHSTLLDSPAKPAKIAETPLTGAAGK